MVRDFCIYEGFSVMVLEADDIRYIVEYFIEGCEWRLYVSRLTDGYIWVLKIIISEYCCIRLEVYNSMVNFFYESEFYRCQEIIIIRSPIFYS